MLQICVLAVTLTVAGISTHVTCYLVVVSIAVKRPPPRGFFCYASNNLAARGWSPLLFLAGSLQDGCIDSLNTLKGSNVAIDFIRGEDKRRNSAKSVFWSRRKKKATCDEVETKKEDTIQQYVAGNGNRGNEIYVKGRISLAWEDADGYATSLMKHISE